MGLHETLDRVPIHFANGYILESTLMWSEGMKEWAPLSSIPELYLGIGIPEENDDFTKWQKEVQEAKAVAEALKNGTNSSNTDNQLSTPPDGKDEFTEDGCTYKWDRTLRKWVPQHVGK
ncbi:uncharacterized protein LOC141816975 [Curcuma longa]|uniref:uncharacterized protein LOC141816975 n=1 Tax=Curcuma longa TaxID=136217 RepID=UPI003D9F6060